MEEVGGRNAKADRPYSKNNEFRYSKRDDLITSDIERRQKFGRRPGSLVTHTKTQTVLLCSDWGVGLMPHCSPLLSSHWFNASSKTYLCQDSLGELVGRLGPPKDLKNNSLTCPCVFHNIWMYRNHQGNFSKLGHKH